VLGTRRDIPLFVHQKGIDEILIAIPSLKEQDLKEIIGYCKESGVSYRIISAIID